jgi:integrase
LDGNRRQAPRESLQDSESSEEAAAENDHRKNHKKSPVSGEQTLTAFLAPYISREETHAKRAALSITAEVGHLRATELTPLLVAAIVGKWRREWSPKTVYSRMIYFRRELRAAGYMGSIPKVPRPQARAVTATPEELARLFANPPAFLKLYMLLYLQCGLRSAETLEITPRSWRPETHTALIRVKGGDLRTVELTPDVEQLLATTTDSDPEAPAIWTLHGKPIQKAGLQHAFRRHADRCHVNRDVTPHDLRRTAATILYAATKDLRVPQQLLGHKSLSSTLTYLAPMAPDEARKYTELLRFGHFQPKPEDKPQ